LGKCIGFPGWQLEQIVDERRKLSCRINGGKLKSRNIENQKTESKIILNNINIMTGLGMPDSYAVIS